MKRLKMYKVFLNPKTKEEFKMETLDASALGIEMPHPDHEQHLCFLRNVGQLTRNFEEYKKLVKNPKFVCTACGRAAASEKNVCVAEEL
jgi:hypothetical protein